MEFDNVGMLQGLEQLELGRSEGGRLAILTNHALDRILFAALGVAREVHESKAALAERFE